VVFDIFSKDFDLLKWLGFKGKPKAVAKPDGHTKTTGPHGEVVDCDTLRCCHCGGQWEVVVGSGRLRGFCRKHMAYTCGRPECMVCMDAEQRLENIEKGLPELTLPTDVSVSLYTPPKKIETK
jgi:hypothetical protein